MTSLAPCRQTERPNSSLTLISLRSAVLLAIHNVRRFFKIRVLFPLPLTYYRGSRRSPAQTMSRKPGGPGPDESRDPPNQQQAVAPLVLGTPPDATTPISRTDPRDWTYIAEGGSTIVFSYDGPRNLHFNGTVIRLRKSPLRSPSDPAPPTFAEVATQDAEDPTIDFQEYVVSRLIPMEFLPHLEHVQVEQAWLEKMVNTHDEKRPAKRRAKDGIDIHRTKAVLATDLIGSKGWAVEIKVCG
jgi:hypothetical protein